MAIAYLDSTCLYGVVDALSRPGPSDTHEWAWKTSIEATSALISSQNVRLAPSPTQDGVASGSFGRLRSMLGEFVEVAGSQEGVLINAKQLTKTWAQENRDLLIRTYSQLKDDDNFAKWLDWALANVWEEHARRLNGLFDPEFIPEIAVTLGAPDRELRAIWKLSANPRISATIARRRDADSRFELLCDAYIISALIRGRYHDYVAQGNSWQIMHHPLREGIFTTEAPSAIQDYAVANTERYLSNILMAAAFTEKGPNRIACWTASLMAARSAARDGLIDLRHKDNDDVAIKVATKAAKELDIHFHSRRLDQVLGALSSLGVGSLASFTLTGWLGIAASAAVTSAGMAAQAIAKDRDPARRLVAVYSASDKRIRDLALAGPGRLDRKWLR